MKNGKKGEKENTPQNGKSSESFHFRFQFLWCQCKSQISMNFPVFRQNYSSKKANNVFSLFQVYLYDYISRVVCQAGLLAYSIGSSIKMKAEGDARVKNQNQNQHDCVLYPSGCQWFQFLIFLLSFPFFAEIVCSQLLSLKLNFFLWRALSSSLWIVLFGRFVDFLVFIALSRFVPIFNTSKC